MKSFVYTIVVLFGALTVAQANTEKPEDAVLENASVEAPVANADIKPEEAAAE